jgi:multiple antibiotic resistance protein
MFEGFLKAFIPVFVAIDPIGLAAIFAGMGRGVAIDKRRRVARHATWTGGVVALLFLFLGTSIFSALGITVDDFKVAGGLILLILAARDLVQPAANEPARWSDDFGVVPLGMPLIAGPALITTLLILARSLGWPVTLGALAANLLILSLAFRFSGWLERLIGPIGLRAISKIVSLLLAAIAVSMIRGGWKG